MDSSGDGKYCIVDKKLWKKQSISTQTAQASWQSQEPLDRPASIHNSKFEKNVMMDVNYIFSLLTSSPNNFKHTILCFMQYLHSFQYFITKFVVQTCCKNQVETTFRVKDKIFFAM